MSTKTSPRTPAVVSSTSQSLFMVSAYLVVIFMVTSTGARTRLGSATTRIPGDVANVHALQAHRSADAQTPGVVDVSTNFNFLGEQTGGAGHDEDENGEGYEGNKYGQSHPELRPLHLFFAWHVLPIAPWTRLPHPATALPDCTPASPR